MREEREEASLGEKAWEVANHNFEIKRLQFFAAADKRMKRKRREGRKRVGGKRRRGRRRRGRRRRGVGGKGE